MEQKQNGTYRWWLITANNPQSWRLILESFGADYAIGQLECGENGTPHLQAALYFIKCVKGTHFRNKNVWAKGVKVAEASRIIAYCKKNQTRLEGPMEIGTAPQSVRSDRDWDLARDMAKEGRLEEIQASILIPHLKNLIAIRSLFRKPVETADVKGFWIFGEPGAGKTHYARTKFGTYYIKPQNKWFDGYMGEETIVLDDLDTLGKCLGHYLKIWADKWAAYGEIKGATVPLCHTKFVVTSNYNIEQIWPPEENQSLTDAIRRRFQVIELKKPALDLIPEIDESYNAFLKSLLDE